jgi:predicted Zn-dependent peptidase
MARSVGEAEMREKIGPAVRKTVLDNGLVIVSEEMAQVRSVSFGIFLKTGSRQENLERHGLTHFIEHALFKGTRTRTAATLASEADRLGGNLDAFTGREIVGFHDKVLDEHLPQAFELVADLVTAPVFDRFELEKERNVILEELKMVEDTPDDIIFDLFSEGLYPHHPLGRPILGTRESLATFTPELVWPYYREIFAPGNLVLAAAGNISHEELVELARRFYGDLPGGSVPVSCLVPFPAAPIAVHAREELEQSHLVIGAPCPSAVSEQRYACHLLSVILGGGMSSRLFQSVREDRGLVYTIYSAINLFSDCGNLTIYAGTSPERMAETVTATMAEVRRLKAEPVGEEELYRNKEQLKASLILNLESTSSRMSALGQQEMTHGRHLTPEEIMAGVDAVTPEVLHQLACQIFDPGALSATVLGELDGGTLGREQLAC